MKYFGAALIVLACAGIGFVYKDFLRQRQMDLRQINFALANLLTGINYSLRPLPELLANCAPANNRRLSGFFRAVAKDLQSGYGSSCAEIWEKNMHSVGADLAFKAADREILSQFAAGLGASDKENQLQRLTMTMQRLEEQEKAAAEDLRRLGKLCTALGWSSGLVFVLMWL